VKSAPNHLMRVHRVIVLAVLASLSLGSDAIGQWTTSQLSASRGNVASTSLPTKALAFFAGGSSPSGNPSPNPISRTCSRVVDIFNGLTRTWSVAQLSAARENLAATSLPGQGLVLFAGGRDYYCTGIHCSVTWNRLSQFARPPATYLCFL
jgi:hypothetical protein